ncbi:hypothetical protein [Methylobacterium tarhaniae]|uniref:hypothetical protein n=1 Tax=Methylobacterium tarhaniae TaxID=1187852 RepID=UPI000AE198B4|nr:hypothetical protein [Methylobacterium tarhaniae]
MLTSIKEALTKLVENIYELNSRIVTATNDVSNVRNYTKETLDEFKGLLKEQREEIKALEKERIKDREDFNEKIRSLNSKIEGLENHFKTMGQMSLQAAMDKIAQRYVDDKVNSNKSGNGVDSIEMLADLSKTEKPAPATSEKNSRAEKARTTRVNKKATTPKKPNDS